MSGASPQEGHSSWVERRVSAFALHDAAPLLIALAAGLICYGLFYNRGLGLSVIGYSIAPAERVMQGETPYRDFLFNYTPGILWVNALLMKAFGATLMATRIGLFAFKLATLIALFQVARKLTNSWAALAPVALTLAWPGYQQIFNVYPDQYLMLFALASLIFMLRYNATRDARSLFVCGLLAGAVFVFKYNVGVLLLATTALALVLKERMTTRRIGAGVGAVTVYFGGFAVVASGLAVYLIYNHALGDMVYHFLHHAAEYSEARSIGLPSPMSILPAAALLAPALAGAVLFFIIGGRAIHFYLIAVLAAGVILLLDATRGKVFNDAVLALVAYFPPFVFFAASAAGVWQLKKRGDTKGWWSLNGAATITGLFALAVYLEVFPRADYYHLVRVLPPVFLFFSVLLARLLPSLTERLRLRAPASRAAALLFTSVPLVFLVASGIKNSWEPEFDAGGFRNNRELRIERGRGIFVEERQAELAEGLVQLIQANSSEDDYIFSFAQRGSAFYFLAGRRNPTRFLWWRSVGISAEEREGVMTMIANRRAKLIVVQDVAANKEIRDFIGDNYEQIGTVADIAVYGLKPLGAHALGAQASVPARSHAGAWQAEVPALPGAEY